MARAHTMDPLLSAKYISDKATDVFISNVGVESAAEMILSEIKLHKDLLYVTKIEPLTPTGLTNEEMLEWLFVLDVLNFCFWSDSDILFTVSYSDSEWTGYRALRAAFLKAIEAGVPIHKPSFYASITEVILGDVLRSTASVNVPMLKERVDCLQEAGKVLIEKFGGSVQKLIKESNQSAAKLVELLFNNFSSFRDVTEYKGQKVFFLKRAQIFVSNVWSAFGGTGYGTFHDISSLSMFADYRVPQGLQFLGVLQYSEPLLKKLQEGIHLDQGSDVECEIRGCSIHAVELIRKKLCVLVSKDPELNSDMDLHAVLIDCYLWNYAKDHRDSMKSYPIHKTYTIFY